MNKISDLCKSARKYSNLSQHGFAKQRGVSHTYIKKIEDGEYDDNPTALTLSNIFKVLQFDISMFDSIDGINHSNDFKYELIRYMDKGYKGTAQINNSYNILNLFKTEFLEKNSFTSIECLDKKDMECKHDKELISGFLYPDIRCSTKCEEALNNHKDVYVFLIDSLSTIKTYVDKEKINDLIFASVKSLVFNGDFNEERNVIYYLTSSEKISNYIYDTFSGLIHNMGRGKNEFYIALCRPKRKMDKPRRIY